MIEEHTALHVLKGAVEQILGERVTTSASARNGKGRLSIEISRKPTEKDIQDIEKKANRKVQDDVPIECFEIHRTEAERLYGKRIYDRFPVPEKIKILKIVSIPDWNLNCCAHEHAKTTGEVGKIEITKHRYRASRGELEISFELS